MNKLKLAALAAVFTAGIAMPAAAQTWNRIGNLSVHSAREMRHMLPVNAPVERLRLHAMNGDVACSSVRATFRDGTTRTLMTGRVRDETSHVVVLPREKAPVQRIDLRCRSIGGPARLFVSADLRGRGRADMMQQGAWRQGAMQPTRARWMRLGREHFAGKRPSTATVTGSARPLSAIALMPVNNDARCSNVRVHFANGLHKNVRLDRLREDRFSRITLPGGMRNGKVLRINMACQPIGADPVTINVFGI